MKIAGVELKRPSFWRLTRAVAFAVVLWTLVMLLPFGEKTPSFTGAFLIALTCGCVSSELGLDIRQGSRHVWLSLAMCLGTCGLYLGMVALF